MTRTLRIFLSHTASGQLWQTGGAPQQPKFDTGDGIPAWQFKIEGRLLEVRVVGVLVFVTVLFNVLVLVLLLALFFFFLSLQRTFPINPAKIIIIIAIATRRDGLHPPLPRTPHVLAPQPAESGSHRPAKILDAGQADSG